MNPVTHFEIMSAPGRGADLQKFYADVFGWSVDADNPMNYGIVQPGSERGIGGGIGEAPDGPAVRVYVEVDDPAAYLKKAVEQGAEVLMEPEDVPGGPVIAMFRDPAGNIMGLAKAGSMPE